MKSTNNVIVNPINVNCVNLKTSRIDNDDDDNVNVDRFSNGSNSTNSSIGSGRALYNFFIDKRSIESLDTISTKDSVSKANTNWHEDRALIYTYYSWIYDYKGLSALSLTSIIIIAPLLISIPNLIIPLGTNVDINNNTNNEQIAIPPINGIIIMTIILITIIIT